MITHAHYISTDTETKPVVVVSTPNVFRAEHILTTISSFAKLDDVYSEEFGRSLVLQFVGGLDNSRIIQDLRLYERFMAIYILEANSSDEFIPSGPYFLQNDRIHQAWRIYADELNAFVMTVIPNDVRSPTRYLGFLRSHQGY